MTLRDLAKGLASGAFIVGGASIVFIGMVLILGEVL